MSPLEPGRGRTWVGVGSELSRSWLGVFEWVLRGVKGLLVVLKLMQKYDVFWWGVEDWLVLVGICRDCSGLRIFRGKMLPSTGRRSTLRLYRRGWVSGFYWQCILLNICLLGEMLIGLADNRQLRQLFFEWYDFFYFLSIYLYIK